MEEERTQPTPAPEPAPEPAPQPPAEDGRVARLTAQVAELQTREAHRLFGQDLAAIRAAYPDETAQSVTDLGVDFLRLCAGGVQPLTAYEALRAQRARGAQPPASMGDIGKPGAQKTTFTKEEVARMSKEEVHRNFDAIRRSMGGWR